MRRGRLPAGAMLLLVGLSASTAAAPSGPVTAEATVTPAEVTVGQTFTLEVRVHAPAGASVAFPPTAGDDEVELELLASDQSAGPGSTVARYRGRCFKLREASVPPIPIRYRLADGTEGEAMNNPVALRIVSAVPKGEGAAALVDIRPPVAIPITALFAVSAAVLVAAVATLVHLLLRRRRRPEEPPAAREPELPADVEAIRALDHLAASGVIEREEYRPFYIALAEIAKRYLERRLAGPVLEMTTTEMAAFLRDHPVGRDVAAAARDLAGAADHVKFARGTAQRAAAEHHLAGVRGLVASLEERLTRTETADKAAGGTA